MHEKCTRNAREMQEKCYARKVQKKLRPIIARNFYNYVSRVPSFFVETSLQELESNLNDFKSRATRAVNSNFGSLQRTPSQLFKVIHD